MNQTDIRGVRETLTSLLQDVRTTGPIAVERMAETVDQAAADDVVRLAAAGAEAEVARKREIRHALDRLACGEYGFCEECGTQIHAKRLAAVPWASLCVPCKQLEEETAADAHRTIAA